MRVRFFQCFNSIYARGHNFSEPVLQHLVNVYCKPYLLYGADVISWTRSELASIGVAFNTAMCKIYKVKFQLLSDIYMFTGQSDITDIVSMRHKNFLHNALQSHNVIVRTLAMVML